MGICQNAQTTNHSCVNSDRCQNNRPIVVTQVKSGITRIRFADDEEIANNDVEPLPMPSTAPVKNKQKKKKVTKNKKIINIQQGVEPMEMPVVVGNDDHSLGYGRPSMIRTGDIDPLSKMRQCLPAEEREELEHQVTPLQSAPPVVGK